MSVRPGAAAAIARAITARADAHMTLVIIVAPDESSLVGMHVGIAENDARMSVCRDCERALDEAINAITDHTRALIETLRTVHVRHRRPPE